MSFEPSHNFTVVVVNLLIASITSFVLFLLPGSYLNYYENNDVLMRSALISLYMVLLCFLLLLYVAIKSGQYNKPLTIHPVTWLFVLAVFLFGAGALVYSPIVLAIHTAIGLFLAMLWHLLEQWVNSDLDEDTATDEPDYT